MPFGISAAIGAGSSLLSGVFGGKAASKAAKQAAAAIGQGVDYTKQAVTGGQKLIGDSARTAEGFIGGASANAQGTLSGAQQKDLNLVQPFIGAGTQSLQSLQSLAGPNGPLTNKFSFNPSDLPNDPGYKFTLQQGMDAIQRSAAAQGGLFSGGTLKSLAGYTTGTANQYFNDAFQRAQSTFQTNQQQALNRINTLQGLAGMGYGATGMGVGAIGQTSGQAAQTELTGGLAGGQIAANAGGQAAGLGLQGAQLVGNLLTQQGGAQAAGTLGQTNSWLSALNQGSNSILGYLANRPSATTPPFVNYGPTMSQLTGGENVP